MSERPITKLRIQYGGGFPAHVIWYEVEFNPLDTPVPDQEAAFAALKKAQEEMRNR